MLAPRVADFVSTFVVVPVVCVCDKVRATQNLLLRLFKSALVPLSVIDIYLLLLLKLDKQ